MNINLKNPDKWYTGYNKLKEDKQLDYLMYTVKSSITDKFFKEANLSDSIIDMMCLLKKNKNHDEMIKLYDCAQKYRRIFDRWFFVDRACIDYYLYKGDMKGIKKHLKGFMEQPVESIDFFIPVLDKIMYYGYTDLVLSISSKLYYEVKDAEGLLPGAEGEFFKFIYDERHQKMYTDVKNGLTIDMDKEKAYFEKYDYEFEEWELDRMQYFWLDDEPKKYTFEDFLSNREHFANDILYMFCDYAHKKNVSFAAAYDIWDLGFNGFEMNMKEAELSNNFNDMFALDKEKYDKEISYRLDEIFSNKVTLSFAVAWGMVYLYDFLYEYGFISAEVYDEAIMTIDTIRNDVIIARATDMWEYGFINKWGMTDGIPEEEYKSDREIIKDSFTSIIKFEPVDDYEESEGEVLNDSMDT